MGSSQLIFVNGKEKALDYLFGSDGKFGYVAIGYDPNQNGFEDDGSDSIPNDFHEISHSSYKRIKLSFVGKDVDTSTGKILMKYKCELPYDNITTGIKINQLAVVDNGNANSNKTNFYAATSFPSFEKNSQTAMTFVLGFKL